VVAIIASLMSVKIFILLRIEFFRALLTLFGESKRSHKIKLNIIMNVIDLVILFHFLSLLGITCLRLLWELKLLILTLLLLKLFIL